MYHIKEAKETIVEFVTKTEDKVKRFERIKYLAIPEENGALVRLQNLQ